jgi:tocopherol O-methyltransferase
MISSPEVARRSVRAHYDLSTVFYRLLWGPHLHHGLWRGAESSWVAQVHLTEKLAELAGIQRGESLLDVGCGMGGSSIHLAKTLGCRAEGVTVSRFQRRWASLSALWHQVSRKTRFRCLDVEQAVFVPALFDVVWSIECTEHLFDKPQFFQNAAKWLKPGGRMGICAWLAGEDLRNEVQIQQVKDVCEGFFCPSLGTSSDYVSWMENSGLQMMHVEDWTERVSQTWEICRERVRRYHIRKLARWIDQDTVLFLDRFDTILEAYRNGAMRYGCFVAHKVN